MHVYDQTLSDYIKSCNETEKEIIEAPHSFFDLLLEMDKFYREDLVRDECDLCAASYLLSANSYFLILSGIKTVLTGHAFAIHPIFRTSLESIIYACYINKNRCLEDVWFNRDKNNSARNKCKREFKINKMLKDVADDLSLVSRKHSFIISDLYEASIDFGAHPNIEGIRKQLSDGGIDGGYKVYQVTALYGSEDFEVKRAMVACLEYFWTVLFITSFLTKKIEDNIISEKLYSLWAKKKEWSE